MNLQYTFQHLKIPLYTADLAVTAEYFFQIYTVLQISEKFLIYCGLVIIVGNYFQHLKTSLYTAELAVIVDDYVQTCNYFPTSEAPLTYC